MKDLTGIIEIDRKGIYRPYKWTYKKDGELFLSGSAWSFDSARDDAFAAVRKCANEYTS